MDNITSYIDSGILELYVCGALNPEESREVSLVLLQEDSIREEVEQIELALQKLATATAPYDPQVLLATILQKLGRSPDPKVVAMEPVVPVRTNNTQKILMYISIAAVLALLVGIVSLLNKNNTLREQLDGNEVQVVKARAEKDSVQTQLANTQSELENNNAFLNIIRGENVTKVALAGQSIAPEAYANVFWDKASNTTYIDAKNLPAPPAGKVYQVWSLKLNPLAPTSLGLLDNFENMDNKIFELPNGNESEGFAISLEPAGGSATPTMELIYVLGAIAS